MFEHRSESFLMPQEFAGRMGRSALVTAGTAAVSLAVDTAAYCYFGGLSWLDGRLNVAMILTGMAQVDRMEATGGKLFYDRERLMSLEVPPAAGT